MKQTTSVEEYKSQLKTLASRVIGLLDCLKLSCFLGGLSVDIRLSVRVFHPNTITDAYSLAKTQEELLLNSKKSAKSPGVLLNIGVLNL